jgi:hypothetical protein
MSFTGPGSAGIWPTAEQRREQLAHPEIVVRDIGCGRQWNVVGKGAESETYRGGEVARMIRDRDGLKSMVLPTSWGRVSELPMAGQLQVNIEVGEVSGKRARATVTSTHKSIVPLYRVWRKEIPCSRQPFRESKHFHAESGQYLGNVRSCGYLRHTELVTGI